MTPPTICKAFVMASGKGSRFGRKPNDPPKTLSTVGGVSLLERNIRLLDMAFPLDTIFLIAGSQPGAIMQAARTFAKTQANIQIVEATKQEIAAGLLGGFAAIAPFVEPEELFIAALGDEYYDGENHIKFARAATATKEFSALCAIKRCQSPKDSGRNFSLVFDKSTLQVANIREKDHNGNMEYFGLGLVCAKGALAHAAQEQCRKSRIISPYELINELPGTALGCEFSCKYVNVNRRTDLHRARNCARKNERIPFNVDVVIPALNEEDSIARVVADFKKSCSQVIVMDNMSRDQTARIARKAGAVVVTQPMGGYGDAIAKGLNLCTAPILAITEADGSFRASDLEKLLPHLLKADAVLGARTCERLVQPGAFMPYPLRLGNRAVGLLLSSLWPGHKAHYTDVGCSLRVMWRDAYLDIRDDLKGQGPEFAPEVALEIMDHGLRVAEVPVSYYPRLGGGSKLSGNYQNSARTALRMLRLILSKRIRKL
ncbi:MAG: glycosyltransferase [Desulfatibacillum sp.]|nr:glycosyltransferase [Desulfatibacillum sp.]